MRKRQYSYTSYHHKQNSPLFHWIKRLSLGIAITSSPTACSSNNVLGIKTSSILGFGYPTGVTQQAHEIRNFWTWSVIIALFVGSLVWGLTFYLIVIYRKKKTSPDFPPQVGYNVFLEASYTIVPVILVLLLFWKTVLVQNDINELKSDPGVVVDVTAFKWNWKFGYNAVNIGKEHYSGVLPLPGNTSKNLTDTSSDELEKERESLLLEKQPHGNEVSLSQIKLNKIETVGSTTEIPVLVLPVNIRIEFRLASADVIHSFYVPEFLFKRDAIPFPLAEHSNYRFQITSIDREGYFVGRCAEMCGEYHSAMNFEVRAVSIDKFLTYIHARESGLSNAEALVEINTPPVAQSTKPFNPSA